MTDADAQPGASSADRVTVQLSNEVDLTIDRAYLTEQLRTRGLTDDQMESAVKVAEDLGLRYGAADQLVSSVADRVAVSYYQWRLGVKLPDGD